MEKNILLTAKTYLGATNGTQFISSPLTISQLGSLLSLWLTAWHDTDSHSEGE